MTQTKEQTRGEISDETQIIHQPKAVPPTIEELRTNSLVIPFENPAKREQLTFNNTAFTLKIKKITKLYSGYMHESLVFTLNRNTTPKDFDHPHNVKRNGSYQQEIIFSRHLKTNNNDSPEHDYPRQLGNLIVYIGKTPYDVHLNPDAFTQFRNDELSLQALILSSMQSIHNIAQNVHIHSQVDKPTSKDRFRPVEILHEIRGDLNVMPEIDISHISRDSAQSLLFHNDLLEASFVRYELEKLFSLRYK